MESQFYFNLREAAIYQAVGWGKWPFFKYAEGLKKITSILFIIIFLMLLYGFIPDKFSQIANAKLLGFSIVLFTFSLFFWEKEIFFNSKIKKPKLNIKIEDVLLNPEGHNLAELLSFEAALAVRKSDNNSTKLLYQLLCANPHFRFVFSRALLNINEIKKQLKNFVKRNKEEDPQLFQEIIIKSLKIAQKKNHQRIEGGDILVALAEYAPIFKKILIDFNLKIEDIENLVQWLEILEKKESQKKKFWEWENLAQKGSIGKDWAAGYTIILDQFSTDWTEVIRRRGREEIIGCEDAIANIERVLSQEEIHNVLLIGEPGTGRKSIIHALTQKLLFGESLPEINYKRVVSLDIVSVLAKCQSSDEVETTLEKIFGEAAAAGNVILVIDEFYSFVSQPSGKPGIVDISPILLRYLSMPNFRVIGITSFLGLHLFIEQNPAILNLFQTVKVEEITEQETIMLLENKVLPYEYKYKRFICYQTIRDIVEYSNRYIPNTPFPKKAVDLLEEVVTYTVRYSNSKVILPEYVSKVISKKTDIPVGKLEQKEKEILLNLEDLIHQRIINQEEAVYEVSNALRRARAEISTKKGPMGTFLFLGPTGVGKTETAKALAGVYFGSEEKMIRLDMSEFQNVQDIPRLLGSAEEEGLLTTPVRENPFSLILLDEIEKSHPNILNLFLQVLDEGKITDGIGRKVDFKNSIIIATSNAGYQIILDALKKEKLMSEIKNSLLDFLFQEKIFRPEFINRFDAVVVFKSLTKENLLAISELLLQKLKKQLKEKEIEFLITDSLKEKIVELGYDPIFGARQMTRVIQDKVGNALAPAIISDQLKKGDKVEVDSTDFKLKINH